MLVSSFSLGASVSSLITMIVRCDTMSHLHKPVSYIWPIAQCEYRTPDRLTSTIVKSLNLLRSMRVVRLAYYFRPDTGYRISWSLHRVFLISKLLHDNEQHYSPGQSHNEGPPKIIVHQSRLVVLRRARVHFLPITVTILLLVVHAKVYIQGPKFSQPFVLGLQVASKFHVSSSGLSHRRLKMCSSMAGNHHRLVFDVHRV